MNAENINNSISDMRTRLHASRRDAQESFQAFRQQALADGLNRPDTRALLNSIRESLKTQEMQPAQTTAVASVPYAQNKGGLSV